MTASKISVLGRTSRSVVRVLVWPRRSRSVKLLMPLLASVLGVALVVEAETASDARDGLDRLRKRGFTVTEEYAIGGGKTIDLHAARGEEHVCSSPPNSTSCRKRFTRSPAQRQRNQWPTSVLPPR
jgi:hypothetical protein